MWKAEIRQPVTGFLSNSEGGTEGTCCSSGRRVMGTRVPTPGFSVLSINGISSQCGQW